MGLQLVVIEVQEPALHQAATVGIPMNRHHVGQIFGGDAKAPAIPVEQPHIASAVARQETVPHMRVAVNDGHRAPAVGALHKARRAIEQQFVKLPSRWRQAIAEPLRELCDLALEPLKKLMDGLGVTPASDRLAEARVVPPMRMEPRPGAKDNLALAESWRQRPSRNDLMRIPEVFEKEPPIVRLGVPLRLETPRQDTRRRCGGDLGVEVDLLPSGVPASFEAIRQSRLEDDRRRRAGGFSFVSKAHSNDTRENGRSGVLALYRTDAAFAEDSGAAKREREALGGDRFWQGFAGHRLAILARKIERLQIHRPRRKCFGKA